MDPVGSMVLEGVVWEQQQDSRVLCEANLVVLEEVLKVGVRFQGGPGGERRRHEREGEIAAGW